LDSPSFFLPNFSLKKMVFGFRAKGCTVHLYFFHPSFLQYNYALRFMLDSLVQSPYLGFHNPCQKRKIMFFLLNRLSSLRRSLTVSILLPPRLAGLFRNAFQNPPQVPCLPIPPRERRRVFVCSIFVPSLPIVPALRRGPQPPFRLLPCCLPFLSHL